MKEYTCKMRVKTFTAKVAEADDRKIGGVQDIVDTALIRAVATDAIREMPVVEHFLVYAMDGKNRIMEVFKMAGTLNETIIYPGEIVRRALLLCAPSIIIVHNHPSGECSPSAEDVKMTQRIREACSLVGIQLVDHIIIALNGQFFSFVQEKIL